MIAYLAAIGIAVALVDDRGVAGHAFGHVAQGAVVGFLGVAIGWFWRPRRSRLSRLSRVILCIGLALFGGGQLIEGLGAFGSTGELDVSDLLTSLHDVGGLATAGGFFVLAAAIPTVIFSFGLRARNPAARLLTLTAAGAVAVLLFAYLALIVVGRGII